MRSTAMDTPAPTNGMTRPSRNPSSRLLGIFIFCCQGLEIF